MWIDPFVFCVILFARNTLRGWSVFSSRLYLVEGGRFLEGNADTIVRWALEVVSLGGLTNYQEGGDVTTGRIFRLWSPGQNGCLEVVANGDVTITLDEPVIVGSAVHAFLKRLLAVHQDDDSEVCVCWLGEQVDPQRRELTFRLIDMVPAESVEDVPEGHDPDGTSIDSPRRRDADGDPIPSGG